MFEEGKIWSVEENNEERKGGKYHVKGKIVADGWAIPDICHFFYTSKIFGE